MTMQWSDHWAVSSLFQKRLDLIIELDHITNGRTDCTIQGRYKRDRLSDAHKSRLDQLLRDHVTTELAHIDAELAKLGVTVTDEPAPE